MGKGTAHNIVGFDELPRCDLHVGTIYMGGSAGNKGDDALAKILPCGNSGGFRPVKCKGTRRAVVLYTTMTDEDWPDYLDRVSGVFTYFGDKRGSGDIHKTHRGGNKLLKEVFEKRHGTKTDRINVPAFLVFKKAPEYGGHSVKFLGLAVPGVDGMTAADDLVAIWKLGKEGRFQNYRATFSILKTGAIRRAWLDQLAQGDYPGDACPSALLRWIETGSYEALTTEPTKLHRTPIEQLPQDDRQWAIARTVFEYFKDGQAFEPCAARLATWAIPGLKIKEITRGSVDGGRDAIGYISYGIDPDFVKLSVLVEAKCNDPGMPGERKSGVGVKGTSRLISRLKHRDLGVLVTTGHVGTQPYKEIRKDGHPVVIIAAADIVKLLADQQLATPESVKSWLESNFSRSRR